MKASHILIVRFILLLCLVCSAGLGVHAQEQSDFESWNYLRFRYKMSKKLAVSFEQQLRLSENASRMDNVFSEVQVSYRPAKRLECTADYRLAFRGSAVTHRIFTNITATKRYKPFDLSGRLRLQRTYERHSNPTDYVRFKLKLRYSRKKIDWNPHVAAELFYNVGYKGSRFNNYRFEVGTKYRINKRLDGAILLIHQQEINREDPWLTNIVKLGLVYGL